jgi:hypothetical protein
MFNDYVMLTWCGALDHRPQGVSRLKKNLLIACTVLLAAAQAEAATIAPHRAIYDLTLLRSGGGSALQSANGKLAFEIQGSACEGWTVSFRMATKYRPAEGQPTLIDTQSTTYEGPGALDFRHQLKEVINGQAKPDLRLKMTRTAIDAEGQGEITSKSGETFTLPAGTSLPMQHQLKLMSLGEAGGGRDSSIIFDGSDETKTFRAISFVGKEKAAGSIERDVKNPVAAPLAKIVSWPMTISYFPVEGDDEIPQYQVNFDMYANGVASGLVLDYGDFTLSGTLTDLQMMETPVCP